MAEVIVNIAGNVGEIEAGLYQGETLVKTIPLNTPTTILDSELSDGGYDPVLGYMVDPTTVKIKPIDPYEITGVSGSYYDPGSGKSANFTEDGSTGVYVADYGTYVLNYGYQLDYEIETASPINVVAPLNRLYWVGISELEALTNIPNTDPSIPDDPARSEYVLNMLSIPFEIGSEFYPDTSNIKLGNYDTGISAPLIISDIITVDLGEIVVSGLEGNSSDYENTFTLVFPFMETTQEIPPEKVIGKTISAEFVIDAYSGTVSVNVYNGGEIPVYSSLLQIGRDLPFKTKAPTAESISGFNNVFNGVYTAYIEQIKPIKVSGETKNLVEVEGSFSSFVGYLEVVNMELKTDASFSEKQEIINLLESGVWVK